MVYQLREQTAKQWPSDFRVLVSPTGDVLGFVHFELLDIALPFYTCTANVKTQDYYRHKDLFKLQILENYIFSKEYIFNILLWGHVVYPLR